MYMPSSHRASVPSPAILPPLPGNEIPQIDVHQLKHKLDAGEDFLLLDVREPWEVQFAGLARATSIPLGQLPTRLAELTPWRDRQIVAICHVGERSMVACRYLRDQGFAGMANVSGGMHAWSLFVDPRTPTY